MWGGGNAESRWDWNNNSYLSNLQLMQSLADQNESNTTTWSKAWNMAMGRVLSDNDFISAMDTCRDTNGYAQQQITKALNIEKASGFIIGNGFHCRVLVISPREETLTYLDPYGHAGYQPQWAGKQATDKLQTLLGRTWKWRTSNLKLQFDG